MPSSLIIVALVVAWLVVLVPMVARRRQEVAKTADSALAARVVRSGSMNSAAEGEFAMAGAGESDTPRSAADDHYQAQRHEAYDRDQRYQDDAEYDYAEQRANAEYEDGEYEDAQFDDGEFADAEYDADAQARPFRPGRGGYDAEAAAMVARVRYAARQRIVVFLLLAAVGTAIAAGMSLPVLWGVHAALDTALVGYLTYLRRQVRIENEIRLRRSARLANARRRHAAHHSQYEEESRPQPVVAAPRRPLRPGTIVVEIDDEDPAFDELDGPAPLSYRRAVGE